MARIRTIKPEFFTSSDIVALSPLARLLYIGLWGEADREGRMKWRPADFKLRILPGDDINIHNLCQEITGRGLVVLYGEGFAHIPAFAEHQHVNPREAPSKYPPPDACPTRADASNLDVHPQVGREGEGREGEGREGKDSVAKATGADAPKDAVKELFDDGVKLLTENGCKESNARSLVGKWRGQYGDEPTQAAIKAARAASCTEPIAWIGQRLAAAGKPHENWNDRRIRETREALRTA